MKAKVFGEHNIYGQMMNFGLLLSSYTTELILYILSTSSYYSLWQFKNGTEAYRS